MSAWLPRAAFAPPLGLLVYAATSHLLLLAGVRLPGFLFPAALVIGGGLAVFYAPTATAPAENSDARVWKVVPWLVVVFLALGLGTLIYGAVATGDRNWDGLVSWSPRARFARSRGRTPA